MTDKSAISAQQLRLKYNHICLYDEEAKEIRRVVNVEWSKRRGPIQAQHSLVTQKIATHTEGNKDNLINNDGDADYQPYSINQELFDMISECPDPYNSSRILINLPP